MLTAASRVPGTLHSTRKGTRENGRLATAPEHGLPCVVNGHQRGKEAGRLPASTSDNKFRVRRQAAVCGYAHSRLQPLHVEGQAVSPALRKFD
jgi:hypothetical protein